MLNRKLAAATVPEALVSLVIIMAVFASAMIIHTRVTASGISFASRQIDGVMSRIIKESIDNGQWDSAELEFDSVRYYKTVMAYRASSDLRIIQVLAFQNEKKVGVLKRVVKVRQKPNVVDNE